LHESRLNGVDPLCRQYDFFAAPTQTLDVPFARLTSDTNELPKLSGGFVTLKGYFATAQVERAKQLAKQLSSDGSDTSKRVLALQEYVASVQSESQAALRHFVSSGTYSVGRALLRDFRLLGEWKPVDAVEKDSVDAYTSGLQYLITFVSNLFTAQGAIDGEAFKAYERRVQSRIVGQTHAILSIASGSKVAQPAPSNVVGSSAPEVELSSEALLSRVSEIVDANLAYALEQATPFLGSDAEKTVINQAKLELAPALQRSFEATLQTLGGRLMGSLADVTVLASEDASGGLNVSARPAIAPRWAHQIWMGAAEMLKSQKVPTSLRLVVLEGFLSMGQTADTFGENLKETQPDGSSTLLKDLRSKTMASVKADLESQKAPLAEKSRKMLYLTAEERSDLENLNTLLQALSSL
jgi:hypothetical protein